MTWHHSRCLAASGVSGSRSPVHRWMHPGAFEVVTYVAAMCQSRCSGLWTVPYKSLTQGTKELKGTGVWAEWK